MAGQLVEPTAPNGHTYKAMSGGGTTDSVEPDWPTDGDTVEDAGETWMDIGTLDPFPVTWTAETPFTQAQLVVPPTPNGHVYIMYPVTLLGGTSGTWPHAGQADPWTSPYDGTDDNPAASNWPTGGLDPTDNAFSGLDGDIYWQDLGEYTPPVTAQSSVRVLVAFTDDTLTEDPDFTDLAAL